VPLIAVTRPAPAVSRPGSRISTIAKRLSLSEDAFLPGNPITLHRMIEFRSGPGRRYPGEERLQLSKPSASTSAPPVRHRPAAVAKTADLNRKPEILKPPPIAHFVEFSLRAPKVSLTAEFFPRIRQWLRARAGLTSRYSRDSCGVIFDEKHEPMLKWRQRDGPSEASSTPASRGSGD